MDTMTIETEAQNLAALKKQKKIAEEALQEINKQISESEGRFQEILISEGRKEWPTADGKLLKLRVGTYWNVDNYEDFWKFAVANQAAVKINGTNVRAWANAERENCGDNFDYKKIGISPYDKISITVFNNK